MAQTSPWAGVPYNSDVTADDVQASMGIPSTATPSSIWASPTDAGMSAPPMPAVMQKPKLDLHANLSPVFAPTPKPNPQDEITGHLQGALENDYKKDADPYGSPDNHPGFLGKLLHGLSVATGGSTRRGWEETGLAKQLNDVVGDEATNNYKNVETGHTAEETAEMPQRASDLHAQSGATTENIQSETTSRDAAAANPTLIIGHAHAVNSAINAGRDPATDPLVQQYEKAIQSTEPGFNKPVEAPKTTDIKGPDGKVHTMGFDSKTGKYDTDEGESGFKPAVTNVNAGEAALDRETTRFAKPYEKGVADANTQLEKIADARSMVNGNAESQALGIPKVLTALVSGAGSGVRITQPELNAIAGARGLGGDVQGTLNAWAGKGKLTPTQQQQLTGILDDVKARIEAKQAIHSNALDTINSAPTREAAIAADKDARAKITALEKGGSQNSGPKVGTIEGGYKFKGGDPAKQENWVKQ